MVQGQGQPQPQIWPGERHGAVWGTSPQQLGRLAKMGNPGSRSRLADYTTDGSRRGSFNDH